MTRSHQPNQQRERMAVLHGSGADERLLQVPTSRRPQEVKGGLVVLFCRLEASCSDGHNACLGRRYAVCLKPAPNTGIGFARPGWYILNVRVVVLEDLSSNISDGHTGCLGRRFIAAPSVSSQRRTPELVLLWKTSLPTSQGGRRCRIVKNEPVSSSPVL